ncbi:MAG: chemotaxis-specific protein-glutamate methyltransferase CheB [Phycisphaerales bacterium]|nr:chemotaxis-specific protein-glutamate methyltransferase CheB [Phycisphaerales bacterium]
MRIAIVNDLRMAQEILKASVARIPGASVAWVAADGAEACARCSTDRPDLILMDMVMPVMDGAKATARIMRDTPCPILVVTSTIEGNLDLVYDALSAGAIDAVQTPSASALGAPGGLDPLLRRIALVRSLHAPVQPPARSAAPAELPSAPPCPSDAGTSPRTHTIASGGIRNLLAIGSSTGGPQALASVLGAIPRGALPPTVVVQHIDRDFAPGLAQWLATVTGHDVRAGLPGDEVIAGRALVATADDHVVLAGSRLQSRAEPRDVLFRPSVDVLFCSLASDRMHSGTAVLLTGMGRDGAAGLLQLRKAGWRTIAQDEASSAVWGMPGAAVALGAAERVLPVGRIGHAIASPSAGAGSVPGPLP